jgi:hypothetical protein
VTGSGTGEVAGGPDCSSIGVPKAQDVLTQTQLPLVAHATPIDELSVPRAGEVAGGPDCSSIGVPKAQDVLTQTQLPLVAHATPIDELSVPAGIEKPLPSAV